MLRCYVATLLPPSATLLGDPYTRNRTPAHPDLGTRHTPGTGHLHTRTCTPAIHPELDTRTPRTPGLGHPYTRNQTPAHLDHLFTSHQDLHNLKWWNHGKKVWIQGKKGWIYLPGTSTCGLFSALIRCFSLLIIGRAPVL
jgi:hypothetical protein